MLNWHNMNKEERISFLTKCIGNDMTSGMIAQSISGATRNAVIGYCSRHGLQLPGRGVSLAQRKAEANAKEKRPPARSTRPKRVPVEVVAALALPTKPDESSVEIERCEDKERYAGPISIMDLPRAGKCRWPLRHNYRGVAVEEMTFCGRSTGGEEVYCPECRRRSVAIPRVVKRRVPEWRR